MEEKRRNGASGVEKKWGIGRVLDECDDTCDVMASYTVPLQHEEVTSLSCRGATHGG